MKVLIVGATGIIGAELVEQADRQGIEVVAISRNGPSVARPDSRVRHVLGDVRSPGQLENVAGKESFDWVIDLLSFSEVDVLRSASALASSGSRYCLVSSATALQPSSTALADDGPYVTEGWQYALAKVRAEIAAWQAFDNPLIVRPYITYGPNRLPFGVWEAADVLYRIKSCRPVVMGDEVLQAKTCLTSGRDVARAVLALIQLSDPPIGAINIVNPEQLTWKTLLHAVSAEYEVPLSLPRLPIAQVRRRYPHLSGKIHDRSCDRIFHPGRLRDLLPDFEFLDSASKHIPKLSRGWHGITQPRAQGRMDSLACLDPSVARPVVPRGHGFRGQARWQYISGYYYPAALASSFKRHVALTNRNAYS